MTQQELIHNLAVHLTDEIRKCPGDKREALIEQMKKELTQSPPERIRFLCERFKFPLE
jgi:hypothetical protein